MRAASLQLVRKISSFKKPSKVSEEAFNLAIAEVAAASRLHELTGDQRGAEESRGGARARSAARYAN